MDTDKNQAKAELEKFSLKAGEKIDKMKERLDEGLSNMQGKISQLESTTAFHE